MKKQINRRDFLTRSVLAAGGLTLSATAVLADHPVDRLKGYAQVEQALFLGINRVKDPHKKSAVEKKHAPVIGVPQQIKAGQSFAVTLSVGEIAHPMGAGHYIQYIELLAGNEPAGRLELRPGLNAAQATFYLTVDKPVTLVAREYCNLHGLWESRLEIELA